MYPYYHRDASHIDPNDERFFPFFPFLPFLGGLAVGGLLAGPRPYYGAPYPAPYPVPYQVPYQMPYQTVPMGGYGAQQQLGMSETINIYPR